MMSLRVSGIAASARAMPKSMTRGPSWASSTLDGLRSRWMTPAAWIACSASATPAISRNTIASDIGPLLSMTSSREGPGTYAVTSHGGVAAGSASISSAVYSPRTRWAAWISWRKRTRKSWSSLSSDRTTFSATGRPAGVNAR